MGAVFVQFTALKNAIMRKLESRARKSIINSLRDEVKAVASVAICLCFCLLSAVTNLPALCHTLADSRGPGFRRLVWGGGGGNDSQCSSQFASRCQNTATGVRWAPNRQTGSRENNGLCRMFQMGHICLSVHPYGQLVPVKSSERCGSELFPLSTLGSPDGLE